MSAVASLRSPGEKAGWYWPRGLPCPPPAHGPCSGYLETAFDIGGPDSGMRVGAAASSAFFTLSSGRRLAAKQRRELFRHPSALCFYPDAASPQGWLTGYVVFHMDGPDVQAFVAFVCFFGIALPLICIVTALLHVNKQQRCRQKVHELRLQVQREQLERELHRPNGSWESDQQGSRRSGSSAALSPRGAASGSQVSRPDASAVELAAFAAAGMGAALLGGNRDDSSSSPSVRSWAWPLRSGGSD